MGTYKPVALLEVHMTKVILVVALLFAVFDWLLIISTGGEDDD